MGAVALAIALVVVALIARDVVLRLSERPKPDASIEQLRASMDGETVRLSETRAKLSTIERDVAALAGMPQAYSAIASELPDLREKVEALSTRISMGKR